MATFKHDQVGTLTTGWRWLLRLNDLHYGRTLVLSVAYAGFSHLIKNLTQLNPKTEISDKIRCARIWRLPDAMAALLSGLGNENGGTTVNDDAAVSKQRGTRWS